MQSLEVSCAVRLIYGSLGVKGLRKQQMLAKTVDLYWSPEGWDGRGMWHVWERGEVDTGFWWGKPEGKGSLGKPRRRWEDNIKMDLQEVR